MNEKALATHRPVTTITPVVRTYLTVEGLEDLTVQEDLILPRWRLVQPSSTIEGEPGQWNNNLTGEILDALELVVLKITPSRAMFNDERQLVCMSTNGIQSSNGKLCADCPLAVWGDDRAPSPCSRGYTFICLDPGDHSLCLVGALSMAVTPAKRYISLLNHQKTPPFAYTTRFTGTFTVAPKGKFFLLTLDLAHENSTEDIARYRKEYFTLATVRITEVEEPSYEEYGESEPPEGLWSEGPEYEQEDRPF